MKLSKDEKDYLKETIHTNGWKLIIELAKEMQSGYKNDIRMGEDMQKTGLNTAIMLSKGMGIAELFRKVESLVSGE